MHLSLVAYLVHRCTASPLYHGEFLTRDHQTHLTDVEMNKGFGSLSQINQLPDTQMGEDFDFLIDDLPNFFEQDNPSVMAEAAGHGRPSNQMLPPSVGNQASTQLLTSLYHFDGNSFDGIHIPPPLVGTESPNYHNHIVFQQHGHSQSSDYTFIPPSPGELSAYNHIFLGSDQHQPLLNTQTSLSNHESLAANELDPLAAYWDLIQNQQATQFSNLPISCGSPGVTDNCMKLQDKIQDVHLPKLSKDDLEMQLAATNPKSEQKILFEPSVPQLWQFALINTLKFPRKQNITAKRGENSSQIREELLKSILIYGKENICPKMVQTIIQSEHSSQSKVLEAAQDLLEEIQLRNQQFLEVFTSPEAAEEEEIFDPKREKHNHILKEQFDMYNWFVKQLFSANQGDANPNSNPLNLIQKTVFSYLSKFITRKELDQPQYWKITRSSNNKDYKPFSISTLEATKTKISIYILGQYYKSSNPEKWNFYLVHDQNFVKIFALLKNHHYHGKPCRISEFNEKCARLDILPWGNTGNMDSIKKSSFLKYLQKFKWDSILIKNRFLQKLTE
ncbi:hypothetical protein PGT21_006225 [Puccinia graminis f. sp. tritici]|uniref:Uncharacterized protein n=1 Tax=Puccinia graminis f. sp. tritici TaxID=56615 RepID=A0A5B0QHR7_PUCGR|nr:hypothetical protein PGT21_006225 [Puccinia graminis f. sp. tritici]